MVYSLRDSATVDYAAPSLTLTKTASPADANTDDETVYVPGWPRAATLAVKGAPALANLDAHPALRWWRPT